ncbi:YopX family protein, partial [Streptococcus pneumoniae]
MIPKFRVWHYELGRLMSVKCMFFQDSEIEEFELNDALMNDYITAYPD